MRKPSVTSFGGQGCAGISITGNAGVPPARRPAESRHAGPVPRNRAEAAFQFENERRALGRRELLALRFAKRGAGGLGGAGADVGGGGSFPAWLVRSAPEVMRFQRFGRRDVNRGGREIARP